jgi:nitroreductase
MIHELVLKNRSYRRFDEKYAVSMDTLKELVDLARLSGTGGNLQPLKFILSCDSQKNALIFQTLAWAGYLKEWKGPQEGERPSAYIVVLGDKDIKQNFGCDHGIAAQSILLGAVEKGLGGCMISSVRKDELSQAFSIAERYEILMVIALGKPVEVVRLEPMPADGSVKYWRDEQQVHHVPKRSLENIILDV